MNLNIQTRATLLAAKAAMGAAMIAVDAALEAPAEEARACQHPNRKDVGTMSNPGAWYCPDCQQQGSTQRREDPAGVAVQPGSPSGEEG